MDPTSSDPQPTSEPLRALFRDLGLEPPRVLTPEEHAERRERLSAQFEAEHAAEEQRFPSHARACGADERTAEVFRSGPGDTIPLREVTAWLASGDTFCLLFGGKGTGKTVAATLALQLARITWPEDYGLKRWRYSQAYGLFVRAADLVRSLHRDGELLQRATGVRVLVLDDLGTEYSDLGERWLSEVDELIAVRHGQGRRTVVTTNLSGKHLTARYGERVRSRILGSGRPVFCGERDMRIAGDRE